MYLWHGTYEENYENILEEGKISCCKSVNEGTEEINELLNEYTGEYFRDNCIYLSNDIESTFFYDYDFKVDTTTLNESLLYIADNRIADNIICEYYDNGKTETLNTHLQRYIDSFKPFEYYCNGNAANYGSIEFLYFGDIIVTDMKGVCD